ncbi:MAG: hypothetical protein JSW07_14515 [bacterium]|nr:MAG: hypothetical protein JSW07_14515 [bacterium]
MKRLMVLLVAVILLMIQIPNYAQDTVLKKSEITTKKMKLLILSSKSDTSKLRFVNNEVTSQIASIATKLGRFEVIDRNNLENILDEQVLQQTGVINDSMVVNFGQIAAAREALIVSVLNFSQKGVPPSTEENEENEDDKDFIGQIISSVVEGIFKSDSEEKEEYPNNIQTQLSVEVRKVNIETGKSLQSFEINVDHTGGTRGKSRAEAMGKLKKKAELELKKFYLLNSEVLEIKNGDVLLFLGTELGICKGTVFEIIEPERIKNFGKKQITVPGHSTGFVSVADISSESNRSKILRQWRPIKPGYCALEYPKSIRGLQTNFMSPLTDSYFGLGIQFHGRPIHKGDWGFSLRYIQATDSYDDKNNGFGFGGFGSLRILNFSRLNIKAKLGLDIDFLFRKDDEDHSVTNAIFSVPAGLNIDLLLTKNADVVFFAGYRFAGKSDNWQYSKDEKTHSAVWQHSAPEVDISGFCFSVGYKLFLF